MAEQNIINAVDYPIDWINNMQSVEKLNGLDLPESEITQFIKREHFLIPVAENLLFDGYRVNVFSLYLI